MAASIAALPVSALPANCCWTENVAAAMRALAAQNGVLTGGYANCIAYVPNRGDRLRHGDKETRRHYNGLMPLRDDHAPTSFAVHTQQQLDAGTDVIGGTGAGHVARMCKLRRSADTSAGVLPAA